MLGVFLLLWAAASVLLFLAPSPVGENITRLRGIVFPLVLLAAVSRPAAAPLRPRSCCLARLPPRALRRNHSVPDGRETAARELWAPALDFVRAGSGENFRVEVVPTGDHWEAYWVPEAGLGLARGWYRQIDIKENELFYRSRLEPAAYRAWLEARDPLRRPAGHAARPQVGGARGRPAPLRPLRPQRCSPHRDGDGLRAARRHPDPLGPAAASLIRFDHDRIDGRVAEPGTYRLAVRHTPYWVIAAGAVYLQEAPDGMTLVHVSEAGGFSLRIDEDPLALARRLVNRDGDSCA